MDKDFLNVKEVSENLKISERVVRKLFNTGKIKSKKIAGKYFTTKDILKEYIKEG
jgi:predicted site-specific integrase-resolvase